MEQNLLLTDTIAITEPEDPFNLVESDAFLNPLHVPVKLLARAERTNKKLWVR